jgi:hypothetical protein
MSRPHGRGETVGHVVRPRERFVVVGEALHGDDRTEDLFLHDLIGLLEVDDDGRFNEEAAVAVGDAAGQDVGLDRALEEAEDALLLSLRDDRSHLDLVPFRRIADAE